MVQLICKPCSTCSGPNEYAFQACTAEKDTVCRRCWFVSHTNKDYLAKCKEYYSHLDTAEIEKKEALHLGTAGHEQRDTQKDTKDKFKEYLHLDTPVLDSHEFESKESDSEKYEAKNKGKNVHRMQGDDPAAYASREEGTEFEAAGPEEAAAANFVVPDFRNKQQKYPSKELEDYEDIGGLVQEGLLLRGVGTYGSGDNDGFPIGIVPEEPTVPEEISGKSYYFLCVRQLFGFKYDTIFQLIYMYKNTHIGIYRVKFIA